ncbi:hypothetical protein [Rodentibacter sp. JRC1]|uniref:hypothetical protein n=1 Tax=Rodentibacter sp. JRC1 TaxID=2874504 RepID=UPI001CFDA7AB|nr:hypothetical protein [Rodentibacter sp. JRC1]
MKFLRNLLLNENHLLSNRQLHIHSEQFLKQDIQAKKQDIRQAKQDIVYFPPKKTRLSNKTQQHIETLRQTIQDKIFSRSDVVKWLNISPSAASELLKKMLESAIISKISGLGKGKYQFN